MKKLLLFGAIVFGLNAFGQVPSYVPSNGLIGWWPFNGNANDESGNGNNGTVSGATFTDDRFGTPNSSADFYGTDDYIEVLTSNGMFDSQSYSMAFWFVSSEAASNPNGGPDVNPAIISRLDIGGPAANPPTAVDNFVIYEIGAYLLLNTNSAGGAGIGINSILDNNWHHIVITKDESGNISTYWNGNLVGTGNNTGTISFQAYPIRFGRSQHIYWKDLSAKLDDIGFWNRALDICEVEDLYNNQLTLYNNVTQNGPQLTADQAGATYQWLDCDNNYSIINGETNQSYTPAVTGNYAVEVNMNGCIDTSACFLVDYTGIEELIQTEKELIKIVDFMGRETEYKPNTPLIFIYSDGTRERVMKLEE